MNILKINYSLNSTGRCDGCEETFDIWWWPRRSLCAGAISSALGPQRPQGIGTYYQSCQVRSYTMKKCQKKK